MRKIIILCLTSLFLSPLALLAQGDGMVRGGCTPGWEDADAAMSRGLRPMRLPALKNKWDPTRTYRQLVILVSYSDCDFSLEDPLGRYNDMFNTPGYHRRSGQGCVADYFRDQSNGMCNLQFDVYGPYKVSGKVQPFEEPKSNSRNYGTDAMKEATLAMMDEHPEVDYSVYDWNGDRKVDQVVYVHAGYCGNVSMQDFYGYLWPSTSSFTSLKTPDNYTISNYTSTAELWSNDTSCGIGTICHEFSHSLGLPDLYPTSTSGGFSVLDEWDLMDGGNFTNYGWCPPNYTPMEKMLLGWLEPVDLTEQSSIVDLKPSAEGGAVYRIMHSDSEWLLLENRQQRGWDFGAPGKGLVIYHVNYDKSVWGNNTVNNSPSKRRYELIHADNLDYDAWDVLIGSSSPWVNSGHLNSRYLSNSPYPYVTETMVNNELTDTSTPPATMHYPNLEGITLLSKPITNIVMDENGLVSFDFMGVTTAIGDVQTSTSQPMAIYDLSGRQIQSFARPSIYIIKDADGTVKKVFK